MAQAVGTPTRPHLAQRTMDLSKPQPMDPGIVAIIAIFSSFGAIILLLIAKALWNKRMKKKKGTKIGQNGDDDPESGVPMAETAATGANAARTTGGAAGGAVDRHESVRSIMTLPPYRPKPLDNEAVLGREGERDGIDTVVELPTAEEDEALREQEMDSLFQIRLARQRQAEEREARREARRAARARNDEAALRAIREEAAQATTSDAEAIALLREEHSRVRETRARAGSSVNYADVGVARNDGTRLRANSSESERVGLLSDAASHHGHQRGRSGSSVLTVDSGRSDSLDEPLRQVATAASGDALGDVPLPPHNPPGYDEVSLTDGATTPGVAPTEPPPLYVPPTTEPTETTSATTTGAADARARRVSARISDVAAEALRADTDAANPNVPRIVVESNDR